MTQATITVEDVQSPNPNEVIKIVHIAGQLDESNVDEKIQEIYKLVETNPKGLNLIFDMEQLEYMNSKSIGYLTDLYGKISETSGQIAIAKAQSNILDILQVVGLTQLIKTFSSVDEAKTYLGSTTAASALAAEAVQPSTQPVQATQAASTPVPQRPAQPSQPAPTAAPVSQQTTPTSSPAPSMPPAPPAATAQS